MLGHVVRVLVRSQHVEKVTPIHSSDVAVIT